MTAGADCIGESASSIHDIAPARRASVNLGAAPAGVASGTPVTVPIPRSSSPLIRESRHPAETRSRLAWLEGEFAEMMGTAIRLSEGIDVFGTLVQALHMGDDGHSRQKAASAPFARNVFDHPDRTPSIQESGSVVSGDTVGN